MNEVKDRNKILMLTTLYPVGNQMILHNTNVCHYFAREWVKMGYEVRVVFNYNVYPWFYYFFYRLFGALISKRTGKAIFAERLKQKHDYEMEGVRISQIPIFKNKPGGLFKKKVLIRQASLIHEVLIQEGFEPAYMVGHVVHPNIELLTLMKQWYDVPTSITLHGVPDKSINLDCLKQMDLIGFRSKAIKVGFETVYGKSYHGFLCYSGIPEYYIREEERKWTHGACHFLYVGSLIIRKHPSALIPAIKKAYGEECFTIDYIGAGGEDKTITSLVKEHSMENLVALKGQLNRSDIIREYDKADVFIMVSENEAFGLVYLEAMARGCIVVASWNEGIDGIIKDGVNGFLCKAGDIDELAEVVMRIKSLSNEQLTMISNAAINTARQMTDKIAAERYINELKNGNAN